MAGCAAVYVRVCAIMTGRASDDVVAVCVGRAGGIARGARLGSSKQNSMG